MNLVIIVGRLTKDVELRYSGNDNKPVARFSVAVQRSFKNSDGKYDADFINCVCFGKQAETIEKYFRKGDRIGLQGEWRTGNYKNKDGNTVYTNDLNVSKFEFVDSKSESQGNNHQKNTQPTPPPMPNDGFMQIPDGIDEELPFK